MEQLKDLLQMISPVVVEFHLFESVIGDNPGENNELEPNVVYYNGFKQPDDYQIALKYNLLQFENSLSNIEFQTQKTSENLLFLEELKELIIETRSRIYSENTRRYFTHTRLISKQLKIGKYTEGYQIGSERLQSFITPAYKILIIAEALVEKHLDALKLTAQHVQRLVEKTNTKKATVVTFCFTVDAEANKFKLFELLKNKQCISKDADYTSFSDIFNENPMPDTPKLQWTRAKKSGTGANQLVLLILLLMKEGILIQRSGIEIEQVISACFLNTKGEPFSNLKVIMAQAKSRVEEENANSTQTREVWDIVEKLKSRRQIN